MREVFRFVSYPTHRAHRDITTLRSLPSGVDSPAQSSASRALGDFEAMRPTCYYHQPDLRSALTPVSRKASATNPPSDMSE